jgi:hypothetical protein
MKKYKDITGESGVTAYQESENWIAVEFNSESVYLYTYASAGKRAVEQMKKMAAAGKGLSTYISQKVKEKYETKIK